MSDMKCPFCQQELVEIQFGEQRYWSCINDRCNESVGFGGNLKLWQELIRTRKALDVALDWLGQVATPEKCDDDLCREFTKRKLAEIKTALEQKDVKCL